MTNNVLITGIGLVSPIGMDITTFWENLLMGNSGISPISDITFPNSRTKMTASIQNYDAINYFSKKEAQRLSKSSQFALIAAEQAVKDANLLDDKSISKAAVIFGSSNGGFSASETSFKDYFNGNIVSPFTIPRVMNNAPASNISIRFQTNGPLMTIDAACASAVHAIGYAYSLVKSGIVDIAITGATDSPLSEAVFQAWSNLRTLSEYNDDPKGACRPFSKDRDGFVLGEGAGVLILESEKSAKKRNVKNYGMIVGYGASSDGEHLTRPSLNGPVIAIKKALENAGLQPNSIDYINAHATATKWNDKVESAAIKEVFGNYAYDIPVVGIKPNIGHSIAGSGALEVISCLLSIRDQKVPPTINYNEYDSDCDLDYVTNGSRNHNITYVMSNSFAFGGSNGVLILGKKSNKE